jgi:hypothetical protein
MLPVIILQDRMRACIPGLTSVVSSFRSVSWRDVCPHRVSKFYLKIASTLLQVSRMRTISCLLRICIPISH